MLSNPTLEQIEAEAAAISKAVYELGAKAKAANLLSEKQEFERKKGEQYTKLMQLQQKKDELKEKMAPSQTDVLLSQKLNNILLWIDGERVRLRESMIVEIKFSCHKHTLKLPLCEILKFQTSMPNNRALLAYWTSVLNNREIVTRQIRCPTCLKERHKKSQVFHVASREPVGVALLKLQVI